MTSRPLLFEIVPNISEGRDAAVVDAAVAAMEAEGARVIDRTSDAIHHRSVITAAGRASQVVAAAVALARVTLERIDLRAHRGGHPRIGALDVLPFVPLGDAMLDDAVTLAHRAAARIWRELGVPSLLYGAAASAPHRTLLAEVRRGEFEALAERSRDARWTFDYGDAPHASAGAIAVGARPLLIAFNVELETGDIALARRIARALRERDGGLRTLRALGIRLSDGVVQVSFNITDVDAVPLYRVRELVRRAAARHGVRTGRSELIGLAPRRALARTAHAYAERAGMTTRAYLDETPAPGMRLAYGDDPNQFGELRIPEGPGPHPIVVLIHGGWWKNGVALTYGGHLAAALTAAGFATWNIEYRRVGDPGGGFPGTLRDVSAAVDALRRLAPEYRLDIERIVVTGHSAGAHLAAWLAAKQSHRELDAFGATPPLLGAVAVAGPLDLEHTSAVRVEASSGGYPADDFLGGTPAEVPDRYAAASPARLLPAGIPVVAVHGTADETVPLDLSQRYVDRARAAGDPARIIVLAGVDHFEPFDPATPAGAAVRTAIAELFVPATSPAGEGFKRA